MQLVLIDNLPFTKVVLGYQGSEIEISDVLVDTGFASSIFSADIVELVQIIPTPMDTLHTIRGVGGIELVFKRRIDFINVSDFSLQDFEIEVGGMDYGFKINGILGMDFLVASGSIINLKRMKLEFDR